MKTLSLFFFLFVAPLHALPLGNPSEPALYSQGVFFNHPCMSLRVGFYGDYVFDRGLKVDKNPFPENVGRDFDSFTLFTNAGYFAFNICRRLDIFATLGETNATLKTSLATIRPLPNVQTEITYLPEFSWSVGGRALLFSWRCFDFGLEGQFFRRDISRDRRVDYSTGEILHQNISPGFYQEGQIGAGVSLPYLAPCSPVEFIPYIGIKKSWTKVEVNGGRDVNRLSRPVGFATGLTITFKESIGATVEGRFGDEQAFFVLSELRF